jgi:hypothetical protein
VPDTGSTLLAAALAFGALAAARKSKLK